nr:hypothetical protein [uncultured Campylobacter sp.]
MQALACHNFSGAWGRAPLAGSDFQGNISIARASLVLFEPKSQTNKF